MSINKYSENGRLNIMVDILSKTRAKLGTLPHNNILIPGLAVLFPFLFRNLEFTPEISTENF